MNKKTVTPEEKQAIKTIYRLNPKTSYRKLAKQFGISKTFVAKIVKEGEDNHEK